MSANLLELSGAIERQSNGAISASIPDWARETPQQFWDPGRKLLATIRVYQKCRGRTGLIARFYCKVLALRHRFWAVVTGADIPPNCQIGGGLLIPHPNGIVIHPQAIIGVNVESSNKSPLVRARVTDFQLSAAMSISVAAPRCLGHVTIGRTRANIVDTKKHLLIWGCR